MHRMLAQLDSDSNLCDLKWVKENPAGVSKAMERHYDWMNEVGHCIYTAPLGSVTYMDVLNWIEDRACEGHRVIVIDPITAADPEGPPWVADRMIIGQMKAFADKYNISIMFVTHPTKEYAEPALSNISGGAAVERFIDCALWLQKTESKTVVVRGACGRHEAEINRIMHLLKVRDGRGDGFKIGVQFDPSCLMLAEQGVIIKEAKNE